jgi:hypothetical protein
MKKSISSLIGMALLVTACGDTTGLGSGSSGVALSFSTRAVGGPGGAPGAFFSSAASADTFALDGDELIVSKVEVVLREIELKKISTDVCDSLTVGDDDCEEFEVGPVLLDLPLNGEVARLIEIQVDSGTYDEIEFDIHKVSNDDPEDAAFRQAYPHMIGQSIRVEGTFNGDAFVYETDLDEEQEYDLVPPLMIDSLSAATNVTVRIDISTWFVDGNGALIDPATANKGEQNEGVVKENIKNSIDAFEDEDEDGDDDDEDDDS